MSQRTTLQVLAALFVLCLSYAPSALAGVGETNSGITSSMIISHGSGRVGGPLQPGEAEAGTYWWIVYFQCMRSEAQGGADWATASETCEALQPTDPPTPSDDPQVPDAPIRVSQNEAGTYWWIKFLLGL